MRENNALVVLNISKKGISDICVEQLTLVNLRILDLSYNLIKVLLRKCLHDFENLIIANLQHNKLIRLEESSFANLKNLSFLDLSRSKLISLSF